MSLVQLLDYIGIVVFAITGALVAARHKNDLIGFCMLGTVTAIGGGTTRDIILDNGPVFWVSQPIYLVICIATSVTVFFFAHFIAKRQSLIMWGDAMGLAVFSVVGTQIALSSGAPILVAIVMGMITATFGGIIRDTLSMEKSLVMRKEIYATAALSGAISYIVMSHYLPLPESVALWGAISIAFLIRAVAMIYDLSLPGYNWVPPEEKDNS